MRRPAESSALPEPGSHALFCQFLWNAKKGFSFWFDFGFGFIFFL